jgi:hypothetical protein
VYTPNTGGSKNVGFVLKKLMHCVYVPLFATGRPLDVTVAACDIKAGDVALSVPENLVVTLDRIFESEGLAEMLTAGKLSELACLTLYMMYEKKVKDKDEREKFVSHSFFADSVEDHCVILCDRTSFIC